MRVCVIVPAYNEAASLPAVAAGLRQHAAACDVCLVDDGSTDDTAAVGARLGLAVLRSPINLGIGGAMQIGYLWARRRGYDAAVQFDGDGQHDPQFIEALLEPIRMGRAALVVGSRFLGERGFRSTALRRIGIRYLAWFLRLRCRARVTDPTSGFRAANRAVIELFARAYPSDYPEPEAIALALRNGLRVQEAPVQMAARSHGESSIGAWQSLWYAVKVSVALLLLPIPIRLPEGPA